VSVSATVVVPTYNERTNLPVLVSGLMPIDGVRLLVVDDQSPDGTADVAEALAREHPGRIEVMRRSGPRGFGLSIIAGMQRAVQQAVDFVCQMDADLSHVPAQLPSLLRAATNADLVLGSRYMPGGAVENWARHRLLLSRFANLYVRAIMRIPVTDCTSGYRCWRRAVLASMPLDRLASDGYSLQVELTYLAMIRGYRIVEVPITFVERREGESKMSRDVILESAIMPWKLVWSRRGGR
jgi:dolichol-phosphate mannosyltransferase